MNMIIPTMIRITKRTPKTIKGHMGRDLTGAGGLGAGGGAGGFCNSAGR
jgi:hypothetical protein